MIENTTGQRTPKQRIGAFQEEMKKRNISYEILFTNDFHQSEYVGEYFRSRAYFSGFTGSAGVLVIGQDSAGLWTDGRYFIQAERQMQGSGVTLFKMGEEGVPSVYGFLEDRLKQGEALAFDPRTISAKEGRQFEELLAEKQGTLILEQEIVDLIWKDRPAMSKEPAFLLKTEYSGMTAAEKIARVRDVMKEKQAQVHLLAALDDIAWLYNIRGNDVECNPVVLSYAAVTMTEAILFVDQTKLDPKQKSALAAQGITLKDYEEIFSYAAQLTGKRVMADREKISYALEKALPDGTLLDCENPEQLMKAVKNQTEIANLKQAHVKDGIACTRFIRWIKQAVKEKTLTEWEASLRLEQFRKEQEGFLEPSFTTICAYNENGAMMHYSATESASAKLKPEGILLVDSGGQYYEGTTDVTRTFCLGPVSRQIREHFTLVLKGMLHLQNARFLYGCTGYNLDILARQPMWDVDLDYKCGTGHGVGYLLNVHEAPNGFRWKKVPERNDSCVLEPGMVTTDEPGIYIEGSHGIRTENELLCVRGKKNEYGQYLRFEPLTMVPVDLELVEKELLGPEDLRQLNEYHQLVRNTLWPYLDPEERKWLEKATAAI